MYTGVKNSYKAKIVRALWPLGLKIENPHFFFQGQSFIDISCTWVIEMSQHFQGPFGPLVLTFLGPYQTLRAIGQRAALFQSLIVWKYKWLLYLSQSKVCRICFKLVHIMLRYGLHFSTAQTLLQRVYLTEWVNQMPGHLLSTFLVKWLNETNQLTFELMSCL